MAAKNDKLHALKSDMQSFHERLAFLTEEELEQLTGTGKSDDAPAEKKLSAVDEWWNARVQH